MQSVCYWISALSIANNALQNKARDYTKLWIERFERDEKVSAMCRMNFLL